MNYNSLLRVAIYLRLSDEDKNKKIVSESIKNQKNLLLEVISKNPNFILKDIYSDEDLSGAGTYRPDFERLIKDCENGLVDVVLCKSQSRFSRDMEIIEKYLHNKFIEWNVRFISIADNVDTNLPGNKKTRQITGLVNEWYLEDISNNIKSAFLAKMKNGEYISPFAPFGYVISSQNNNKIIVDLLAAPIVKNIFNLYLNGYSYTGIANYLNKNNIPSPSLYKFQNNVKLNITSNKPRNEIKWTANSIKNILKNEIYIGNLVQGKRTTISYKNHKIIKKDPVNWIKKENVHEPIIDKNTFYQVQSLINSRQKSIKSTNKYHIFSGKVFCDKCQKLMRKKSTKLHDYLSCDNKNCKNKKSIRYDALEKIILDKINIIISTFYDDTMLNNFINSKSLSSKINFLNKQKNLINNKVSQKKLYLKKLYEDKVNNIITEGIFNELLKEYQSDKALYLKQLKKIDSEIKKIQQNTDFDKYKKFNKLNKIIIDEFIKNIYININYNVTNIKISWNF